MGYNPLIFDGVMGLNVLTVILEFLGIKIIGPWPLDPLGICLAKINSNCIHKGKEKFVWGGEDGPFLK